MIKPLTRQLESLATSYDKSNKNRIFSKFFSIENEEKLRKVNAGAEPNKLSTVSRIRHIIRPYG
jgi:hypothetical protein